MSNQSKQTSKTPASVAAHLISDLLSPLLVPTYGMIIALWATSMRVLALSVRLWATAGIALITAVIPFIIILLLLRKGKISDMSVSDRRQRTLPFCIAVLCYIAAALFLLSLRAPLWLVVFYAGAALVTLLTMIITRRWKISAHTGGIGGLLGVIFWLVQHGVIYSAPLMWLSVVIIATGLVAWSRLYLRHHTATQIFAGAAMAFIIEYSLISIVA